MTVKEDIITAIKEQRPLLGETSLKTYSSLLNSLFKKLDIEDVKDLGKNKSKILAYINGMENHQSRKTMLSPLVILTDDEDYKTLIAESTKHVNDKYRTQRVDLEKLKGLMTMDELREHYNQTTVRAIKSKKESAYQDLLLSIFFTGVVDGLPPRRLMDYTEMKTKNYNKSEDNWTDGRKMVFNKYKTVSSKGQQVWVIPKELQKIVKRAIKMGEDNEYLLYSNNGKKYSPSTLSKKLKGIYGTSVDGLRAIFISNMYKGMPAIEEMERIADMMGHSASTAVNNYVKLDLQR
jgi:hypothetical protein